AGRQRSPEDGRERGIEAQDEDPPRGVAFAEVARPGADRQRLAAARNTEEEAAARLYRVGDPLVLVAHDPLVLVAPDWTASSPTAAREIGGGPPLLVLLGKAGEEGDQRVVDLGGALLLSPVARAGQQHALAKPGHGFGEVVHGGAVAQDDGVAVARDEEGGH